MGPTLWDEIPQPLQNQPHFHRFNSFSRLVDGSNPVKYTMVMRLDFLSHISRKPRNSTMLLKNPFFFFTVENFNHTSKENSKTNPHVSMSSFNNY